MLMVVENCRHIVCNALDWKQQQIIQRQNEVSLYYLSKNNGITYRRGARVYFARAHWAYWTEGPVPLWSSIVLMQIKLS